jgi:hypothetical protein
LPQEWNFSNKKKKTKIIAIRKPEKESSDQLSKFHPISLLNIGGKVLENVLINRINHFVFSQGFVNTNQCRFTPQKGTVAKCSHGVKKRHVSAYYEAIIRFPMLPMGDYYYCGSIW